MFDKQPVDVTTGSANQAGEIEVISDGQRLAASSVDELFQSLLLVNSDVYITGSRPLADCKLPDVLSALDEIPFLVRGYPESDTEKLLLIAVSRERGPSGSASSSSRGWSTNRAPTVSTNSCVRRISTFTLTVRAT